MNDLHRTARLAGLLYFVMSLLMVFGYMYVPAHFYASDDVQEIARRIAQDSTLYRFTIWIALVAQLLFVFVAVNLYELFKDVDRKLARVMTTLVLVGIAAELVNVASRLMPVFYAAGGSIVAGLSRPQLDALTMASMRSTSSLGQLLTSIWGLWLVPFGLLVLKSRFLPKILGWMLIAAGSGYMISCSTYIVFPEQLPAVSKLVTPLYFGELPVVFWLALFGARDVPWARFSPLASQG